MAHENGHDSQQTSEDASHFSDSFNRLNINSEGVDADGNRLGPDGEPAARTEEEYAVAQLTLRAIVSSKEAGVIIGKAGKNVADLRDETGVKAGVSKVVQGVHDRVLTVTGALEGVAKAYAIVAKGLLEGAPQMGMGGVVSTNGTHRKSVPPCSIFRLILIQFQQYVFSFLTIKWVLLLVDREPKSSIYKTLPVYEWLPKKKCFHNRQSVSLRCKARLKVFKRLFGRLASASSMTGNEVQGLSSTALL
jgi:hypothetical protein